MHKCVSRWQREKIEWNIVRFLEVLHQSELCRIRHDLDKQFVWYHAHILCQLTGIAIFEEISQRHSVREVEVEGGGGEKRSESSW